MQDHQQLFQDQINSWPLATQNYHELSHVLTKEFKFNNFRIKLQYNPNRIISSSANIDKNAIKITFLPVENYSFFAENYYILISIKN